MPRRLMIPLHACRAGAPLVALTALFFGGICAAEDLAPVANERNGQAARAQEPVGLQRPSPLRTFLRFSYAGFYYDSDVPGSSYCLENSEGRCLDSEYNSFATLDGYAAFRDKLFVVFEAEQEDDDRFHFRKAYARLRTGNVSWRFGKDSVWLGNGYHGSLLLSNNAEAYTLLRMTTDEFFRLPWIFSHMGDFSYDLFHGWLDDFNILGHRLVYRPVPLIEFGASQTAIYDKSRHFEWYEYPRVLFSSDENTGGSANRFNNDQRASLDVLHHMPYLAKLPPFKYGKLYIEYAGEDSVAWWQEEDGEWVWPLGFDLTIKGWLYGMHLATNHFDYRFEYAKNYPRSAEPYGAKAWYAKIPYSYKGSSVGHHMGPYADDLFFEVAYHDRNAAVRVFFDKERHGVSLVNSAPETRKQFGIVPSYRSGRSTLTGFVVYNRYTNVDDDPDPLRFAIRRGTTKNEWVTGLNVSLQF